MKCKQPPAEALVDLRRRLAELAPRSAERVFAILEEPPALPPSSDGMPQHFCSG